MQCEKISMRSRYTSIIICMHIEGTFLTALTCQMGAAMHKAYVERIKQFQVVTWWGEFEWFSIFHLLHKNVLTAMIKIQLTSIKIRFDWHKILRLVKRRTAVVEQFYAQNCYRYILAPALLLNWSWTRLFTLLPLLQL